MTTPKEIFSAIYDQYIEKIYRFVYLKVGSQETAEDITADTFLKGWQAFEARYSDDPLPGSQIENIQAFLYQIARNLIADHYRQKNKMQVISAEYSPIIDPRTNTEDRATLNSDMEIVKKAIRYLKEDYQNVIIWHYIDDLPISEVANLLDRSEEATRVLLSRAIKSLRGQLHQAA